MYRHWKKREPKGLKPTGTFEAVVGQFCQELASLPDKRTGKNSRYRPYNALNGKFILYFLLSPKGRDFIKEQAATTSGLYTLSLSKVEGLKIPLMSSAEQENIVEEIESRLSICDQLETDIEANLKKTEALRQTDIPQVD